MHTPEPWILDKTIFDDDRDGRYVVIFCPEGLGYGRVAMVYAECGREEELLPNAHLIKAAPIMLQALEVALASVQWMADATDADSEDHERLTFVQNAIAKAKGETQ